MSGYPGQAPTLNDLEQAHHLSGSDFPLLENKHLGLKYADSFQQNSLLFQDLFSKCQV